MRYIVVIKISSRAYTRTTWQTAISGWILLCCLLLASVVSTNWQFQLAIETISGPCNSYFYSLGHKNVYDDDCNSFATSAILYDMKS